MKHYSIQRNIEEIPNALIWKDQYFILFLYEMIRVTMVNKIWLFSNVTILQYIICMLYSVFTTQNKVYFQQHLSPFTLSYLPPPHFPSDNHHSIVCDEEFVCFFLIP